MSTSTVLPERQAFGLRLAVGIVFGLGIAALTHHPQNTVPNLPLWKAVVVSTLMLSAFIWWAGAGAMRRVNLIVWGIVITAVIAALGWHQSADRADASDFVFSAPAAWLILPFLFIAHELVSSGDQAGRLIAPYATYFDQAWKRGVQLALSLAFTGLFWGILWLGAALLGLIGFHWLKDLLEKDWFSMPATGAAVACAVQLGDVQDKLLSNVRALALSVLSWLLPVIALIGLIFLGSLCASGLGPLWKTKAATSTLLGGSIAFVLLINAAYQQGDTERPVNAVMKWAARAACVLLLIFSGLAAYSLKLRIDEYGLTPERVLAGAGVVIAALFGIGYAVAAVMPGRWLHRLEVVNIAMAFAKVLIFLGLLSPIADPTRLGVDDQVARLQSARVTPEKFDWVMLRFDTGAYGRTALKGLKTTGKTGDIRALAAKADALSDDDRYTTFPVPPPKTVILSKIKVVYPSGGVLPQTLTAQALTGGSTICLTDPDAGCTAALIDADEDGQDEVLFAEKSGNVEGFTWDGSHWEQVPELSPTLSPEKLKAFNAGQIELSRPRWSTLTFGAPDATKAAPK